MLYHASDLAVTRSRFPCVF